MPASLCFCKAAIRHPSIIFRVACQQSMDLVHAHCTVNLSNSATAETRSQRSFSATHAASDTKSCSGETGWLNLTLAKFKWEVRIPWRRSGSQGGYIEALKGYGQAGKVQLFWSHLQDLSFTLRGRLHLWLWAKSHKCRANSTSLTSCSWWPVATNISWASATLIFDGANRVILSCCSLQIERLRQLFWEVLTFRASLLERLKYLCLLCLQLISAWER